MQEMKTPAGVGAKAKTKRSGRSSDVDPVVEAWSDLEKAVKAYVRENVDDVIVELANAHAASQEDLHFEDPVDALEFMLGSSSRRKTSEADSGKPKPVRTHIIVAGQASQFKPLRTRLSHVIDRAGLGKLIEQDKLTGKLKTGADERNGNWLKSALDFFSGGDDGAGRSSYDHSAVSLTGLNLKDGCARGALDWYSSKPVMENPGFIHGQIVIALLGGGHEHWVDMDRLNDSGHYELTAEELKVTDAWSVYYLPSRGLRGDDIRRMGGAIMGTLMACNQIEIAMIQHPNGGSQLAVFTRTGGQSNEPIKLRDSLYGADGAQDLRAMLWPTVLLEE
jgi:hypothetical protein